MNQTLWHTVHIQIPDKMLNISKTGKVTIKKSLTKTGMLSKSNHEPSIIITTNSHINEPKIIDDGEHVNEVDIRKRQLKLKAIKNKLSTLPNKQKISKKDFADMVRQKLAFSRNIDHQQKLYDEKRRSIT